jgi:hypothetical protein
VLHHRDHHDLGAGGGGDLADRAGQYRRHLRRAGPGKRWSKKYLLAGIYTAAHRGRGAFILLPITPGSVLVFSV